MDDLTHNVTCSWVEGMAFDSTVTGHTIRLDGDASVGGSDSGPRPKPLMLTALAGCTGMDVIYILRKMKIEPSFFNIRVTGRVGTGPGPGGVGCLEEMDRGDPKHLSTTTYEEGHHHRQQEGEPREHPGSADGHDPLPPDLTRPARIALMTTSSKGSSVVTRRIGAPSWAAPASTS